GPGAEDFQQELKPLNPNAGSGSGDKGKSGSDGDRPGGKDGGPGQPGSKDAGPGQPTPVPQPSGDPYKTEPYLTLKPALREMLLRVETKPEADKILFSSASHLRAALMRSKNADDFGKISFRLRPIW